MSSLKKAEFEIPCEAIIFALKHPDVQKTLKDCKKANNGNEFYETIAYFNCCHILRHLRRELPELMFANGIPSIGLFSPSDTND
jgi:hypothetical protein